MRARIDMRRLVRVIILAAVAIGSFGLTLWATGPVTTPSGSDDVERFASYGISSPTSLVEAAVSLGYSSKGTQMAANVDGINRINDREVMAHGWLVDSGGDATPLKLLVFVDGKLAVATDTQGERPDITRALALTQGTEKNVTFQANFLCSPGQQPIMVGLGLGKQYLRIKSPPCP